MVRHTGQRLHDVGIIGKKLSKLVLYTLLRVLVTLERIKYIYTYSLYKND